jgi:hypothetical protein
MVKIGAADLSMYPPDLRASVGNPKISVVSVTMNVTEVLRGAPSAPVDSFLAMGDIFESLGAYANGVEVLVCMKYHPVLRTYCQGSSYGIYRRVASGWRSLETARGRRTFADAEIRSKIDSMDIDHVASEAELIVEGTIDAVAESEFFGPDSSSAGMVTVTLKVASVEKGSFAGDAVVVKTLVNGMYLPEWRKHVPQFYTVGQHWLCFLKKNEVGWYPFAGTNGLLRIEDDGFVYDERVPFWYSRERVAKAIADARAAKR